jgi:hypothetical protein
VRARATRAVLNVTIHRIWRSIALGDLVADAGDLGAEFGAEDAEVVLGGDVLPGGGRQVGHEGVGLLGSEQRFELAVQIESCSVVDRHVGLLAR